MVPSEQNFRAQIEAMRKAFAAEVHLSAGLSVTHQGLRFATAPPLSAQLGAAGIVGHWQTGNMRVEVNAQDCGAPAYLIAIESRILAIAAATVPDGKIYDHFPVSASEAEDKLYYLDRTEHYNAWFIRHATTDEIRGGGIDDDLVAVAYGFEFQYFRGYNESE